MNVYKNLRLLILILCTPFTLMAQQIKINAEVEKHAFFEGDTIAITYTSQTDSQISLLFPKNEKFEFVDSTMSFDHQLEVIKCIASFIIKYPGKQKIPQLVLIKNEKSYKSNLLNIDVKKKPLDETANNDSSSDNFFDDVTGPTSKPDAVNSNDTIVYKGKQLFASIELDRQNVYKGEQIFLEYNLYSLTALDIKKYAPLMLSGFWIHDLTNNDSLLIPQTIVKNGMIYLKYNLARMMLFPFQTGMMKISAPGVTCYADIETDESKNTMSGSLAKMFKLKALEKKNVLVTSNSAEIFVKSLPIMNDEGYNGLVGSYQLSTKCSDSASESDGIVEIEYSIFGEGNLKFINSFGLKPTEDWDISDPVISDSSYVQLNKLFGVRRVKYILNSNVDGVNFIPEFNQVYFNPVTGQYQVQKSERRQIRTKKGADDENALNKFNDIMRQPHFLMNENELVISGYKFWMIFMCCPLILFAGFYAKKYSQKQMIRKRYYYAKQKAIEGIEVAKVEHEAGRIDAFYTALYNTLWNYVKDKFMIQSKDLNKSIMANLFSSLNIDKQDIDCFINLNDSCQMRLYGKMDNHDEQLKLIKDLETLIFNLENHVNETTPH